MNVRATISPTPGMVFNIDDVRWFIANPGIFLWEEDGRVWDFLRLIRGTDASGLFSWIRPMRVAGLPAPC